MATETGHIQFVEGSVPSTPATGKWRLYTKTTGLFIVDDAGTEYGPLAADGAVAHIADATDAHDASAISFDPTGLSNTAATELQTAMDDYDAAIDAAGGSGVSYFTRRLMATPTNAAQTIDVNSTSYLALFGTAFYHDWDFFPATHFWITVAGQSSAAANTITLQLTPFASPTNPVSAAGDDLVVTNTLGLFSSGWIAVSDAMAGIDDLTLAMKGSSSTVDLAMRFIDIAFKID